MTQTPSEGAWLVRSTMTTRFTTASSLGVQVQVQVFGAAYARIADGTCCATTICARRDEWIGAGIIDALEQTCLKAYDQMTGLDLSDIAGDGCIVKASRGGEARSDRPSTGESSARNGPGWSSAAMGPRSAASSPARTATTRARLRPDDRPQGRSAAGRTAMAGRAEDLVAHARVPETAGDARPDDHDLPVRTRRSLLDDREPQAGRQVGHVAFVSSEGRVEFPATASAARAASPARRLRVRPWKCSGRRLSRTRGRRRGFGRSPSRRARRRRR